MKQVGMLFNTDMVQAIVDGEKRMTRRMPGLEVINERPDEWLTNDIDFFNFSRWPDIEEHMMPRILPGDTIWVRETWTIENKGTVLYKQGISPKTAEVLGIKWRPSLFMPKEHARLWLPVTGVRVERLQSITEHDARLEGCTPALAKRLNVEFTDSRSLFTLLWKKINGEESWNRNPWVWVYRFSEYLSTAEFNQQN